jgi:hypothetical protein
MIDRQHGEISFECDACDEVLDTSMSEWAEAMTIFRNADWRSEKVGDEWTHLCPKCQRRTK